MRFLVNTLQTIADKVVETDDAFVDTMEALARACEYHDDDTDNHLIRVNEYSNILAREFGQSDRFVYSISYSAQMHDVGKIHKKMDDVFTSFSD